MAAIHTDLQAGQHCIKQAVTGMLCAIGEDHAREGLIDTPRRAAKAYAEPFAGYAQDPAQTSLMRESHD